MSKYHRIGVLYGCPHLGNKLECSLFSEESPKIVESNMCNYNNNCPYKTIDKLKKEIYNLKVRGSNE